MTFRGALRTEELSILLRNTALKTCGSANARPCAQVLCAEPDLDYLVNCQSTPAERDAIEEGCRKALKTLATK